MPPPPQLKPVSIDPKTTALLLFDFMDRNCNEKARPRCLTVIPTLKKLDDEARSAGMLLAYTLPGGGKIVDQSIAPRAGEVVDQKQGGPDKFLGALNPAAWQGCQRAVRRSQGSRERSRLLARRERLPERLRYGHVRRRGALLHRFFEVVGDLVHIDDINAGLGNEIAVIKHRH